MTQDQVPAVAERPEDVPSGYFWTVGGVFFALISWLTLFTVPFAVVLPGIAAWFCFYVGSIRSKRRKAAIRAAAA